MLLMISFMFKNNHNLREFRFIFKKLKNYTNIISITNIFYNIKMIVNI